MQKIRLCLSVVLILTLVLVIPFVCVAADDLITYGDADGDGEVTLLDVLSLRQYFTDLDLATGEASVEISAGADADGDGEVDLRDLLLLRRYYAKYDYDNKEPSIELGANKPKYTYTSGDGAVTSHYENANEARFSEVCDFYVDSGYSEYCSNQVGELRSATYTKSGAVYTVTYNKNLNELYVTRSNSGAEALPEVGGAYAVTNTTTVTQNYSSNVNGMCYFVKLADGSFIVIDGGYAAAYNIGNETYEDDAVNAYNTLVELNGGSNNIHIRAWLITHSHGDHYRAFKYFANNYAGSVKLDTLLCSPVAAGVTDYDSYLTVAVKSDAAKLGAEIAYVRTGMSLELADVTMEILLTPEQIYKIEDPKDFNETSVVCRVKNDDGSMIFLGDCGVNACNWMVDAYGDALKSDMVQVSHHGAETATAELYDKIAAHTFFWPCNESLLNSYRGEYVKQHILESSSAKEHILHGYGTATRPLSYKSNTTYLNILPDSASDFTGSAHVTNVRVEDGVLKYEVSGDGTDPYVYFNVSGVDSTKYNAVKLVVGTDIGEDINTNDGKGDVFFKMSSDTSFKAENKKIFSRQGTSDDGKMTVIVYFGNLSGYSGTLSQLRIDLGHIVGETVEIYSAEAYYVDIG